MCAVGNGCLFFGVDVGCSFGILIFAAIAGL
jgi:hypothetical protein